MSRGPVESSDRFLLLFEDAKRGSEAARNDLYRASFPRLRSIATMLLDRERPGHTLQPTALVSELFLKLQRFHLWVAGEEHFFRVSARAMKQVLIDHARGRRAGRKVAVSDLEEWMRPAGGGADPELRLAAKVVFERLESMDPAAAATVWLRYVEGLSTVEIAKRQMRELWRVKADCDFGVRWMANQLERAPRRAESQPKPSPSLVQA